MDRTFTAPDMMHAGGRVPNVKGFAQAPSDGLPPSIPIRGVELARAAKASVIEMPVAFKGECNWVLEVLVIVTALERARPQIQVDVKAKSGAALSFGVWGLCLLGYLDANSIGALKCP